VSVTTRRLASPLVQHMLYGECECCAGCRKEEENGKEKGSAVGIAPAAEPRFLAATLALLQRGTARSTEPAGTTSPFPTT
jgi:hypothetical protein